MFRQFSVFLRHFFFEEIDREIFITFIRIHYATCTRICVVTLCNIVVRLSLFLLRLIPKIANKCEVTYSIICSSNA